MARRVPLRLAVAGAGLIGRAHVERIRQHDDCVLAAVVDPSPAAARIARDAEAAACRCASIESKEQADGCRPRSAR